jgi:hypothetical protein
LAILNEDAQWIVLMGFIVAIALFFLAVVVNESTLVGQTTAESVLDFSKSDIEDLRSEVLEWNNLNPVDPIIGDDIRVLMLNRKYAAVNFSQPAPNLLKIHYNDGVTKYDETITLYT